MEKIVPIKVDMRVTKVNLDKVDAIAISVLMNACQASMAIANAFKETGRYEAAIKIYDGISLLLDGHKIIHDRLTSRQPN